MKRLKKILWVAISVIWLPFELIYIAIFNNVTKVALFIHEKIGKLDEHVTRDTTNFDDNSYH